MRFRHIFWLAAGGFAVVMGGAAAPVVAQQHGYSADQIAEGRKLYDANCGRCHNNDGAGVPGVELFKQLRRATTDDDVAKLIQTGIPNSSMPPHSFSNPQALAVVAFLRSMVGATPVAANAAGGARSSGMVGDAVRGREIFTGKGRCADCHRPGSTSGPDLSRIAAAAVGFGAVAPNAAALERSILEP